MTIPVGGGSELLTSIGVGTVAVVGGVAKGAGWLNPNTGATNWALLTSGVALSLVMASVVRAAGVHYGIEPWVQVAGSGVLCYIGPDPILRAIAAMALKKFGVNENGNQNDLGK